MNRPDITKYKGSLHYTYALENYIDYLLAKSEEKEELCPTCFTKGGYLGFNEYHCHKCNKTF